jgi:hypothetical protein
MSVISGNVVSLADWVKRLDPDGKTATVIELLNQTNEVLQDMAWQEGNLPTGHRVTQRSGLPATAFRLLNKGVAPSKSTTVQIDEACGMLEAWSEIDKDLVELNGNAGAFRLSEARAFIESMNEKQVQTLFYGNSGLNPEQYTGLTPRYNTIVGATNGSNVLDGGAAVGQTDLSSIWLVCWGDQMTYGIFPKGSKAGLQHDDLGLQVVENVAGIGGDRMLAYRERWQWKCGIAVKDWRFNVRIANIDISQLIAKTGANLFDLMIKALHRIPTNGLRMTRPVFYMNRTVRQMLDIQARDAVQVGGQLKYEVVDGQWITTFRGIPIRIVDQLIETEARVV